MLNKILRRKDKQFIFNFAAILGVACTMYSTIKDTKKALQLIDDDMTAEEKIKNTWKCYIPSGLIATSTVMCIVYSDYVSMNEKMSILNALISSQNNYKILKTSIDETCDSQTKEEIMKKNIRCNIPKDIYLERTEEKIFYEEYRGTFFKSTIDNILKAEYMFNKQLAIVGYASLNDLYKYIGIPETNSGNYLGWSVYDGYYGEMTINPWTDFTHQKMEDDSGIEYFYLGYSNQPDVNYDIF